MNLSGFRIMSECWNDGCILRRLGCLIVSFLLYYMMVDHILNVGHRSVMVNVCRSSQERFGYDCTVCKNIQ